MLHKIKGVDDYARDSDTYAVLSVSNTELTKYKKNKEKNKEYQSAIDDINNIKLDLNEIKNILSHLVQTKVN
jgi:DNA-binding transcriptional regulator YhcF (GntR family)